MTIISCAHHTKSFGLMLARVQRLSWGNGHAYPAPQINFADARTTGTDFKGRAGKPRAVAPPRLSATSTRTASAISAYQAGQGRRFRDARLARHADDRQWER